MNEAPTNRRQQALAGLHRATATITDLFDAKDALHAALASVAAAASGPDPLRAAVEVVELAARVSDAVDLVNAAALDAAMFIPRRDVATHLDSRTSLVFARAGSNGREGLTGSELLPPPAQDSGVPAQRPAGN